MSLAKDCRRIASRHPPFIEALREGIVNYRALARRLKDEIEQERNEDVDLEAITSALRRYGQNLQKGGGEEIQKIEKILENSKVSLRGSVVSIAFKDNDTINLPKEPILLVKGRKYTTAIFDEGKLDNNLDISEEKKNLACLIVESPKDIVEIPGVLSRIVSRLTSKGINIVDITSCYTETIIIVKQRDAGNALEALESVLK